MNSCLWDGWHHPLFGFVVFLSLEMLLFFALIDLSWSKKYLCSACGLQVNGSFFVTTILHVLRILLWNMSGVPCLQSAI